MTASLSIKRPGSALSRRSRSTDSHRSNSSQSARKPSEERMEDTAPVATTAAAGTAGADAPRVPAFLGQTRQEISEKFQELEWAQRTRLLQGIQNPDASGPWAVENTPETKARNRYLNVYPWANNRIHLRVPPDHCDYINASPIILHSTKPGNDQRYIATQGPKEGQFSHIWRMIWHETADPAVIVMLTQTWEAGRDKCFQYFPEELETNEELTVNDEDEFSDGFKATVKLESVEQDVASRSTVRKLTLSVGEESKTVWHLLFSGWPDFSIPEGENRAALLELIKLSERVNTQPDNPRIVHCSAGVGRSGTFITLGHLLQELEDGSIDAAVASDPNTDVIYDTVNKLREQRMTMVQSEAQLDFIYQVLREKWQEKNKPPPFAASTESISEPQRSQVQTPEIHEPVEEVDPQPPGAYPESPGLVY